MSSLGRGSSSSTARGGARATVNHSRRQGQYQKTSYHQKKQAMGMSGEESDWHSVEDSLALLPECSGLFRLGLGVVDSLPGFGGGVEVVYISHTTEHRTLREMVSQVLFGWEGGTRLAMMVVNPSTRSQLMCKWTECIYPEDLIEDEIEEHIIEHSCPPTYNTPVDDSKGIWVVVDDDDVDKCSQFCQHPSNTVYPPR
ncbi:uncharacterized protein LOC142341183 isoform X2 [Convolutriloba macropyga]|uniref:uncharacterized protein LOC142341183 isoform X2 n=1 Tax=Convolutriloba macropyga TaxID=536237 RepID=UPI003F520647